MKLNGPKIKGMKIYEVFQDPAHGWCKVAIADLVKFKIEDQISNGSYTHGKWVFLEEDRDFPIFLTALTVATGKKFAEMSHYFRFKITSKRSRLRSHDRYDWRIHTQKITPRKTILSTFQPEVV